MNTSSRTRFARTQSGFAAALLLSVAGCLVGSAQLSRGDLAATPASVVAGDTVSLRALAAAVPGGLAPAGSASQETPLRLASAGSGDAGAMTESAAPAPQVNASFVALVDDGTAYVPDIAAAVGPQHLMVALNSQIRIQDRAGQIAFTIRLNDFWASLGNPVCNEPRLLYDPYQDSVGFSSPTRTRAAPTRAWWWR